jgi:hypothetical protein
VGREKTRDVGGNLEESFSSQGRETSEIICGMHLYSFRANRKGSIFSQCCTGSEKAACMGRGSGSIMSTGSCLKWREAGCIIHGIFKLL